MVNTVVRWYTIVDKYLLGLVVLILSLCVVCPVRGAIKAFKKGVIYHGEDCNRGPKNDPPILEPAFLLVNR